MKEGKRIYYEIEKLKFHIDRFIQERIAIEAMYHNEEFVYSKIDPSKILIEQELLLD